MESCLPFVLRQFNHFIQTNPQSLEMASNDPTRQFSNDEDEEMEDDLGEGPSVKREQPDDDADQEQDPSASPSKRSKLDNEFLRREKSLGEFLLEMDKYAPLVGFVEDSRFTGDSSGGLTWRLGTHRSPTPSRITTSAAPDFNVTTFGCKIFDASGALQRDDGPTFSFFSLENDSWLWPRKSSSPTLLPTLCNFVNESSRIRQTRTSAERWGDKEARELFDPEGLTSAPTPTGQTSRFDYGRSHDGA